MPSVNLALQSVVTTARRAFRSAACSVAEVDAEGTSLRFEVADGEGAAQVVGMTIPLTSGIAGWSVVSGQAIAVADVASDARFDADAARGTGSIPSTILAAPIIAGGDSIGVIEVLDPGTEADLELLGRFADLAGHVLALRSKEADHHPAEQELLDAALRYARSNDR